MNVSKNLSDVIGNNLIWIANKQIGTDRLESSVGHGGQLSGIGMKYKRMGLVSIYRHAALLVNKFHNCFDGSARETEAGEYPQSYHRWNKGSLAPRPFLFVRVY